MSLTAPNPVGDSDHLPLGPADVHAKLATLVGGPDARRLVDVASRLAGAADVGAVLADLP